MLSENWTPNLVPKHKPLESLKQTFKQRLDSILNSQLTVENIETFADDALSGTIKLTDDVLAEYKANPNVHPSQIPLDKQLQENEAYAILGLPNISEILQSIINVKEKIDALRLYISESNEVVDEIVIPPQTESSPEMKSGSGKGIEEKKLIPRLLTLLYILETDFDVSKDQAKITQGQVSADMVRQTPYVRIEVPDIERIVYICDEEGNASYIFDTDKLEEAGIHVENLDISDKGTINDLLAKHPGIGARIIQTKYWRTNMADLLANPIPEKVEEKSSEQLIAEFRKKEFLPFDKFSEEVAALYSGEGSVEKWYREERKIHTNWPSQPSKVYKNNGWIDWPALVGKENFLKREYLSFDDFQTEVTDLYPGTGNVQKWYYQEKPDHPNWHSNPPKFYKEKGWIGWSELVNKENRLKKGFLPFNDFQAEVRAAYQGQENVEAWYRIEKVNRPHWPTSPGVKYKKEGWIGFPELVGKENIFNREYPSFEDFQTEVANLYNGEGDAKKWYLKEKGSNHPNWPYSPDDIYKDKGWIGWSELVGKENKFKKEFPLFETLQAEVSALYPGNVPIYPWYKKEKENHPHWPSFPPKIYKGKGWVSWLNLVEKKN